MSDVKKDDKKDGKKEEKSIYAMLITVGLIALAAWAFFIFIPIPVNGIFNGVAQLGRDIGNGLGNIGESEKVIAQGIKNFFSGFGKIVLEIVLGTLIFIIIGLMAADYFKTTKKAGSDTKADDKAAKPAEPAKH